MVQLEIRGNISEISIKSIIFLSDDHVVLPQLKSTRNQLAVNFLTQHIFLARFLGKLQEDIRGEQQDVVSFESIDIIKDAAFEHSDHLQQFAIAHT